MFSASYAKMQTVFLTLALLVAISSFCFDGVDAATIMTNSGLVRGRLVSLTTSLQAYQFSAIPYAMPPIGKLRYKKTVPVKPWNGILDATAKPKVCPQITQSLLGGIVQLYNPYDQSEDCLFLNIWVPRQTLEAVLNNQACKPLAVYFYIHGGGYMVGGSTSPFNGSAIAALNNVIVVTIQYRLGSLGFAYFGTKSVPGNMGLWDQLEALKWVSNNIGAFGGDNSKITIGGESAGAVAVTIHLLSPYSRPYFQGAIVESGSVLASWLAFQTAISLSLTNAMYQSACNQSDTTSPTAVKLACLKSIPAENFPNIDLATTLQNGGRVWAPVIDGDFIPREPLSMLQDGDFYHVPMLAGFNSQEGTIFIPLAPFAPSILAKPIDQLNYADYTDLIDGFTGLLPAMLPSSPLSRTALYLQYWPRSHQGYPRGQEVLTAAAGAIGEGMLSYPTLSWINLTAQFAPVYAYFFNYRSVLDPFPEWMGAKHTDELAYAFGTPFFPNGPRNYSRDDKFMSRVVMAYWANFVKFGNPNGQAPADAKIPRTAAYLPQWPRQNDVTPTGCVAGSYLNIAASSMISQTGDQIICDVLADSNLFWHDLYPKLL